jgi:hypothetical protein
LYRSNDTKKAPCRYYQGSRLSFNLDLQDLLHRLYEQGSYDLAIDYRTEPMPPLSTADAAWVDKVLCEQGLR